MLNKIGTLISMNDYISECSLIILMVLSIIQISPIKINPWDTILNWFGQKINKRLEKKIFELEKIIEITRSDVEEQTISEIRWNILNFSCTCRKGEQHTKEQWHHVLDQAKKYEEYIKKRGIANGVIEADTQYIRKLYNKLAEEGEIQ